jgi:hypothetical protein
VTTAQVGSLGEKMAELADSVGMLLEMSAGYRRRAVQAGFSEDAAERVALELHHRLLGVAFRDPDRG